MVRPRMSLALVALLVLVSAHRADDTDEELLKRGGVPTDADGILTVTVARKSFGHAQPAFGRCEMPEECVTSVGQREDVMGFPAGRNRRGHIRPPLKRVAGRP